MTLETRVKILEEVLSAALLAAEASERKLIKYKLRDRRLFNIGSCGDGAFDSKQREQHNWTIEQAELFVDFGVLPRGY